MYNIYLSGSKVTIESIVDYLANRPKFDAIFKQNKGVEYINEAAQIANRETFNYYYLRLKKFSLLRAFSKFMDVSYLYDPNNILDIAKKQKQEDWLDSNSLVDIADTIEKRIEDIRYRYIEDDLGTGYQAGEGIHELLDSLKEKPEVGIPLYGRLINTITRGARLRKFYLRSAATSVGKTRAMVADACNFACNKIYHDQFGWINNGTLEPTLFIATEQDKNEIQTMCLAFLSNVDEEHILNPYQYLEGEEERVEEAASILETSPLWIEELPDFSLQDVENKIKKNIRERGVKYICYDYIHTSLKILEEISKKSGGVKLREDNVLFMISARLKDLANKYGVFIISSTQLNGDWKADTIPDQNLLRGAKSLADKIDLGMILLRVTDQDLIKLNPILDKNPGLPTPNIKMSIYKNRRGRYTAMYLWCSANLGTCRIEPQFATDWHYEIMSIEDMQIMVNEPAAWEVNT